ncbi:protein-methionine-sulfoxide reductase heme-binding subunit MsrQ [Actibacterium sp. D379-3]
MRLADFLNARLRRFPAWPLYIVGMLPAAWFLWLGLTGGLGVEPIRGLEHALGKTGLKLLVAVLAVTPLRRFTGVSLLRFRRALGLLAFFYILLHLAVWLFLDVQDWGRIWADIVKRPYITIGMAGFVLMLPLALTSNTWSVRRLGLKWRQLHRLTYPAAVLGALHFVMLVKGWQIAPLIYLLAIGALLALRFRPARRRVAA